MMRLVRPPSTWPSKPLGERALAWVEKRNAATKAEFSEDPRFKPTYDAVLTILNAKLIVDKARELGADVATAHDLVKKACIKVTALLSDSDAPS